MRYTYLQLQLLLHLHLLTRELTWVMVLTSGGVVVLMPGWVRVRWIVVLTPGWVRVFTPGWVRVLLTLTSNDRPDFSGYSTPTDCRVGM